jgi:hypothetical protein
MDPKTTEAAQPIPSGEVDRAPVTEDTQSALEALRAAHREARRRRDAAKLGSKEHQEAVAEVGRIEVEMARVQRDAQPPLV